jgi:putative pyruvate formate lyase activating enzyme
MKSGNLVVLGDGSIRIIDPDREMLPVLKELDPGFEVLEDPPPQNFVPWFQRTQKSFICGLTGSELEEMETPMVWAIHNVAMDRKIPLVSHGEVSLLDLKVELGSRILGNCDLCGWNCRTNRYEVSGRCGAKIDAYCNGVFEHICEEEPINTAMNIKLAGCPMKCAFCQTPENHALENGAKPLGLEAWELISRIRSCRSIEFVGGEPMVSCAGILSFLSAAPEDFSLPVVMNCSAYLGQTGINLMDQIVDVWMPDLNFGNDACAKRLSMIDHYWETAKKAISRMCGQEAKIIVRMLVIPGHVDCCHKRALDWLSRFRNSIWISIMDQYLPLHDAFKHNDINRIPNEDEIQEIRVYVRKNGLSEISDGPLGRFWK